MIKISVSFLSKYNNSDEVINKINQTSADYIHVDVFDGLMTTNLPTNFNEMSQKLLVSQKPLDIHIMSLYPSKLIDHVIALKPERISIHIESKDDLLTVINKIDNANIKVGLVINPDTEEVLLESYLCMINHILIMGVYPGRSNQLFLDNIYSKIDRINYMVLNSGFEIELQVDGGVTKTIAHQLIQSGVSVLSTDSFVTNTDDYETQIQSLKKA